MNIPSLLIELFPPAADLLLDRTRRYMEDALLVEIANADYGYEADEMLELLRAIRDQGVVSFSMIGQLAEVLELSRFRDPASPVESTVRSNSPERSGNLIRLFCCTVLLRAPADSNCAASEDVSLAIALSSSQALGDEMNQALGSFLTWQIPRVRRIAEPVLFAMGLLLLAARTDRISERQLGSTAEWALAVEDSQISRERRCGPFNSSDPPPAPFSVSYGFWRPLASQLRAQAASILDCDIRSRLELCALAIE